MRIAPLFALLLPACTATVLPGISTPDAAPAVDVSPADASIPAADLPAPATDVPAPQGDVPPPTADATAAPDVPGPPMNLAGRWRVVRYQFRGMDGSPLDLRDETTTYVDPNTGTMVPVRTNGALQLTSSRFALALAVISNDHIRGTGTQMGVEQFSAVGLAVPGLLDDRAGRFNVTGGQATYTLNALGPNAIRVTFDGNGNSVELARDVAPTTLTQLNLVGAIERLRPTTQRPLGRPRAALFWVRPGGQPLIETNGVALQFGAGVWAPFPLVLAEPPVMAARFAVGGVFVAAAMILVYDDLDNDQRLTLTGGDALRGISNITVAWRGDGDGTNTAFTGSGVRDLLPGYQLTWRTRDFSTGAVTLVPFDNTRPIAPDAPVSPTELDPTLLESAWR
jgi:hypothetical protein